MKRLRPWIFAILCLPLVTVCVAFVLAQSQFIRLVGTAPWTTVLWPLLEWTLAAGIVAVWYWRRWPRWMWSVPPSFFGELALCALGVAAIIWIAQPDIAIAPFDAWALVGIVLCAPAVWLWCSAEETVLRGVMGRLTAGMSVVRGSLALVGGTIAVVVLVAPSHQPLMLLCMLALEGLSMVGYWLGHPLSMLALRRWTVRMLVVSLGVPAVGFASSLAPAARLNIEAPAYGPLLVISIVVVWGCVIAARAGLAHNAVQQIDASDV
jgi:hypothetical protein